MANGELTATSFLVLGMLTTRDHSAYEIAEQVGRGLDEVWPRADRQRYNAARRLLELGLVDARVEATGRRNRTVYSINEAGRRALTAWLATEPRKAALEIEGVVRLILADQGSIDDLRRTLEVVREQARTSRDQFLSYTRSMAGSGGGTFPKRRHVLALANRFMVDHFTNIADWASWALTEIEAWPDTTTPVETDEARTTAILRQVLADADPDAEDEDEDEDEADADAAEVRPLTRRELYEEAKRRGLRGRSSMGREELARALGKG